VEFEIEDHGSCEFDRLDIYDGPNEGAPLLARVCGDSRPGDMFSDGNTMFLQFTTDSSVTLDGFEITYSTKDSRPVDGGDNDGQLQKNFSIMCSK